MNNWGISFSKRFRLRANNSTGRRIRINPWKSPVNEMKFKVSIIRIPYREVEDKFIDTWQLSPPRIRNGK